MTLGEKLAKLRRERSLTQEQLAELLGVSRQAISKWESNAAYPETEKLIRLAQMYDCSLDYLLLDRPKEPARQVTVSRIDLLSLYIEKVSDKKIGNLPLWHINIGYGRVAKGVFAVGLVSKGIVSVGLFSLGVVSLGVASVGLIALGSLALGLISIGAVSVGVLALGAVAVGVFSIGASATGLFAVGAAAFGKYAALGDTATARVAIALTKATGTTYTTYPPVSPLGIVQIENCLKGMVPKWLNLFKELFLLFLR